ncbi:MAG: nitrous oxide reductase accessory protein NosL [Thermomicrobiales bacterium]
MNASVLLSRRIVLAGAALTPLALIGCGGQPAAAGPPEISYGRDTCDRCGMIISEERFAAALTSGSGEPMLFDDPGELLLTVAEQGRQDRHAWVHDRANGKWIDATTAAYVRGDDGATPMGTGVVAFAKREDAAAFRATSGGDVLTWDEATQPPA